MSIASYKFDLVSQSVGTSREILEQVFSPNTEVANYVSDASGNEFNFVARPIPSEQRAYHCRLLKPENGSALLEIKSEGGAELAKFQMSAVRPGAPIITSVLDLHIFNFLDRIAQKENVMAKLNLARELDANLPLLLEPEHIAYSMAWKEIVNPKSTDYRLFYPGIGCDFVLPLLTTNATHIDGVTNTYCNPSILPEVFGVPNLLDNPETVEFCQNRKEYGFWNYVFVDILSLELLIPTELKTLGIDLSKVKYHLDTNRQELQLNFDWAYPGETPKPRTINIKFKTGFNGSFAAIENNQKYDCLFARCPGGDRVNSNLYNYMMGSNSDCFERLNSRGHVLVTPPSKRDDKAEFQLLMAGLCETLSVDKFVHPVRDFERLVLARKFKNDRGSQEYGWKLFGVQKP